MNDHLTVKTSGRGFDSLPAIPSQYGGEVSVYESSAATEPCIWLNAVEAMHGRPESQVAIHLSAEGAWKLADQLRLLVREHYQGDSTPEWAS